MNTAQTPIKFSKSFPPNYGLIEMVLHPPEWAVFSYGDTIFNPSGRELRPDVILHEEMHRRQQGADPEGWWKQYLFDEEFRYAQELEAYGEQYAFAKKHGIRGKMLQALLDGMAEAFSSDYGVQLSHGEAASKIRNYLKT